ncbi:MAG: endonuclease domain-containing protein [Patescibacteria group bacterium]
MTRIYNKKSQTAKRKFLRGKLSLSEIALWKKLKTKKLGGYKFRRQYGFGRYVVDFYCPALKLAIEIDGPYHKFGEMKEYDPERQVFIESFGVKFLRFSNEDVSRNLLLVLSKIESELSPPLQGGARGGII